MFDESILPVHPVTGLTAVGLLRNGAPVWPALGGAEDDDKDSADDAGPDAADEADKDADGDQDGDSKDADGLGDAGKKALDAMKAKWRAERSRAKDLESKLADAAKPKPDEDKPDLDAIKAAAKAEAVAESMRDKALDKLEAKAARLFENPEDARAFLAGQVDDFIDGVKVDVDAITDALSELLKNRPYLGVTQGDDKKFKGDADSGPRGGAGKPQLTKDDVENLAAQGKHAEIDKARVNGNLDTLLGIKTT